MQLLPPEPEGALSAPRGGQPGFFSGYCNSTRAAEMVRVESMGPTRRGEGMLSIHIGCLKDNQNIYRGGVLEQCSEKKDLARLQAKSCCAG